MLLVAALDVLAVVVMIYRLVARKSLLHPHDGATDFHGSGNTQVRPDIGSKRALRAGRLQIEFHRVTACLDTRSSGSQASAGDRSQP